MKGKYALYTDAAGLVAHGITKKRAEAMAKRLRSGGATITTLGGTVLKKIKKKNPARAVRVKNFTGTIRLNPNKTVSIKSSSKRRKKR